MEEKLTSKQVSAIKCAHADLLGALQCHEQLDYQTHDWRAHKLTLQELEDAFPTITETYNDTTF